MDPGLARVLNDGDDEDDALRRALALSVAGHDGIAGDGDLKAPPHSPDHVVVVASSPPEARPQDQRPAEAKAASSFLSLDRQKMEEERLARLRKRKEREFDDVGESARPPVAHKARRVETAAATGEYRTAQTARLVMHSTALPFPLGVVKKTWAAGQTRTGHDIKVEEVLLRDELQLAVLSSFQWDEEWLLSKIDIRRTKVVLIAYASSEAQVREAAACLLLMAQC